MIRSISRIAAALLFVLLSACAGMQNPDMTTPELDILSKQFEPSPEKSSIYIIRPSTFGGKGIYIHPTINDVVVGSLASGTYLMLDVLPGDYSISAAGNLDNPVAVKLTTEAGRLYFAKMYPKVKIGLVVALSPGLHNEIVGTEEGKELVLASDRYKEIEYSPVQQASHETRDIYIFRQKTLYGAASNHKLSPTVDNRVVGSLEMGTYLTAQIPSGQHTISAAGKFEGDCSMMMDTTRKEDYFMRSKTEHHGFTRG